MKRVFLLMLLSILISGCINISAQQEVYENGTSTVMVTYDLSQLGNMGSMNFGLPNSTSNITQSEPEAQDLCANISANWQCEQTDDFVMEIQKTIELPEDAFQTEESLLQTQYRYQLGHIHTILSDSTTGGEGGNWQALRQMGAEATYTLQLPGELVETDKGTIQGDQVEVSLFELVDDTDSYAVSRQQTFLGEYLVLGAGIITVILLLIVLFVVLKRHQKSTTIASPPTSTALSEEDKTYRDYVQKYKQSYDKQAVSTGLQQGGLSKEKADEYVQRFY